MHNTNKLHVLDNCVRLCVATYELTGVFPTSERFGLTGQMRRASVSVGSNIAEGSGRFTDAQFVQSLSVAHGSASELDFQTRVAVELRFMSASHAADLRDQVSQAQRMIRALADRLRK